jgi:SpoVK/Ycf46/Vps4 family AAA+-type ATPase
METYRNNLEHLQDEFRRLDLLLARAVREFRLRRAGGGTGPFPGLVISDEEIDHLICETPLIPDEFWSKTDRLATLLRAQIHERSVATQSRGIFLRLPHLITVFDLDAFEADLLVLALLPHYSRRYQRLYAFLQDDLGNVHPTVELALQLFCVTDAERIDARGYFAKRGSLFNNQLLEPLHEGESPPSTLLNCPLLLDRRIADFLFGSDRLNANLETTPQAFRWVQPRRGRSDLLLADSVRNLMDRVVAISSPSRSSRCLLHGPDGAGKKTFAEVVCAETGQRLLVVNLAFADPSNPSFRVLLQSAFREARLYSAAIYLDSWHRITQSDDEHALQVAEELIAAFPGHVFLGSRTAWRTRRAPDILSVEVPLPDEDLRRRMWEARLREDPGAVDCDALHLAGAFRFTPGQIDAAMTRAESIRLLRAGDDSQLTMSDLLTGCRAQSSIDLVSFARKLEPKRGWPDLILPKDTTAQLHEFCQQVRHRACVFDSWGFGRKLTLAKGFIALFSGPSGTGKTLSAEVLANDLGLDLYRVDLSCVVSKYIGETEKNLSRVFDDAQMSNAILFFDEADALFGKRSEVKDAHDRYANIEINYLLQRVEEYEGIVILASNLSNNIDSAFIRRMRFCIELPFPDEAHRRRIWRGVFPSQTPIADDIDFDFLARKFKLAGGNIQNVALAAAFSAADNGGRIAMEHLVLALKREYQKLGRVCDRADFEHYYDLVR